MDTETVQGALAPVIELTKIKSFVDGYEATDQEVMGLIISKLCEWDGKAILETLGYALEDSNFHSENEVIQDLIAKL